MLAKLACNARHLEVVTTAETSRPTWLDAAATCLNAAAPGARLIAVELQPEEADPSPKAKIELEAATEAAEIWATLSVQLRAWIKEESAST